MQELLTQYRRALHRIPELDSALPQTAQYIRGALSGLPCRVTEPIENAVCAFFDAGKADTIAFRADMDALPIAEQTGQPYASCIAGQMHACGHDGHMALLLALAQTIGARLQALPHNVLLLFQPAEETTGGAKRLCESGVLEQYAVRRLFALHIWPGLPAGELAAKPGAMMAQSSEVSVHIAGKSVHIAKAAEGADALLAGARFLCDAYAMAQNEFPPDEPRLLKFGYLHSGTVRNALSADTELLGSLRSFDAGVFAQMKLRLREIADALQKETGCAFNIHINEGFPPTLNDPALYARVMAHLGAEAPRLLAAPSMTSEDFSFYGQRVPTLFAFLGAGDTAPLHANTFDFDEKILLNGLAYYERLLYLS
ncbi:MAG: amidohydrolase [Christensenellaceae bacterium]|jgi:hippurate hydrolase|nr:amidohydrolase [Christensenellaceae bacterium]